MPVSDIAKIAAMFNDNPLSQVSAYRKDAQDFYTAPDRVALDNALNYGNTQKAYEAEQRRLGQQQMDAYRSQNLYDQNTGAIRNSADIYGDAIRNGALSNMYGINASADAARIGSQQIAATQAALGNNNAALNYLNQVGQGGSIPLSLNGVDPAVFRGYAVQGAPVSETRQYNQETTNSNRAYQQQLLEDQQAQQEKIAKLNNDRALEVAKIKMGSDAAASDQQIIADGIKLATGSDGIINKDTLTTYLTLMRGGQQVAQQVNQTSGEAQVDLANPTTVKPPGNPMLDAARGMNTNNSGAQTNTGGTQVQQQGSQIPAPTGYESKYQYDERIRKEDILKSADTYQKLLDLSIQYGRKDDIAKYSGLLQATKNSLNNPLSNLYDRLFNNQSKDDYNYQQKARNILGQ